MDDLIEWLEEFTAKPKKIFVVHGEKESSHDFAKLITERLDVETFIPKLGQTVEINGEQKVIQKDNQLLIAKDRKMLNNTMTKPMFTKRELLKLLDKIWEELQTGE